MDATAIVNAGIEAAGSQLTKVISGLTDEQLDLRPHPAAMTLREQLVHQTEAYIAMQADAAGAEHEWGSYKSTLNTFDELQTEMFAQRQTAVDAVLAKGDEAVLKSALFFLVLHDGYHIGQLCTLHIALDPEWNAYSIY